MCVDTISPPEPGLKRASQALWPSFYYFAVCCVVVFCYFFSSYFLVINCERISQRAVRTSLEKQLDPTGPVAARGGSYQN